MRPFLVILLLVLAAVGGGWYLLNQKSTAPETVAQQLPAPAEQAAKPARHPAAPAENKPLDAAEPIGQPLAEGPAAKPADANSTTPAPASATTPASADAPVTGDSSQPAAAGPTPVADTTVAAAAAPTTAPSVDASGYRSLFPAGAVDHAEATLCYFSFNRETEFTTVHSLVSQMNANSPINIKVVELIANDENIKDAISKAVESGIHCDGVVLTGHHHGKFWGDRTSGSVKAKFIEELSCDSRYAAWFANVKALWMEGCHTGTINPYNDEVKDSKRVRGSPLSMMRSHLDFSDVRGSASDMESVIEDNLSDENIANDYQRIFPYATIFGWSGFAPGEKAGSHYSFPYHITQVSHLADPDDEYFKDPMHGKLEPKVAHRYAEVLYGILKRPNFGAGTEWPAGLNEANFIKGWYNHGDIRKKYALDNGALVTRKALVNSDTELLRSSRALRCVAYQPRSTMKAPGGVVNYLTSNASITPFASELLLVMMQQSGGGFSTEVRQKISHSDIFRSYLKYTAQSQQAAEFRRTDASALLNRLGAGTEQSAQNDDAKDEDKKVEDVRKVEVKSDAVQNEGVQKADTLKIAKAERKTSKITSKIAGRDDERQVDPQPEVTVTNDPDDARAE